MSRRTSLLVTAAAALVAVVGSSDPVRAQPVPPESPPGPAQPQPGAADKERARALHAEGLRYYEAGQYGRAITAYRKAYALVPAPGILFNLAQAYRLRGDCRRANRAYRSFVEVAGSSPEAQVAREHMRSLRSCVERSQRGDAARASAAAAAGAASGATANPPPSPPAPSPAPASPPSGAGLSGGAQLGAPSPAVPGAAAGDATSSAPAVGPGGPERDVDAGQNKKLLGLGAGAAGAALLAVGVYYGLQAHSEASDLNQFFDAGGAWTPELASREDALHRDRTLAIGFTLVGAGAVGTGVVLYWLGHKEASAAEARARSRVTVAPQPGGAAVIWHRSF